jgi:hypothetical protein
MQINKQASIKITSDGQEILATTTLSLNDLQKNGVAWCEPIKGLSTDSSPLLRIGTYLNVATICRESGLLAEELGVLRRAAREFGQQIGDIGSRIQALSAHNGIEPVLPAGWSVVSFDRDAQGFKSLAGIEGNVYADFWHPGARFGGLIGTPELDSLPKNETLDNVSFHICWKGALIATVPAVVDAMHTIAWVTNHPSGGAMPIEVHFSTPEFDRVEIYKVVLAYLNWLTKHYGASQFLIMERPEDKFALYRSIIKKGRVYSAELWDRPIVNLGVDAERLYAGIRKSYKSSINWCAKNLVMEYLSGEALTNEKMNYVYSSIQNLHKELLEKYADGMTTELFMHPMLMCKADKGEVAIARTADGVPWGLTVSTWDGGIGYYALGGSRVLQGKNTGHFIVYDAILRAKERGLETYVMNRFFPASVALNRMQPKIMSDRSFNIAFFKRGYSDDTEFVNVYSVLS